MQCRIEFVTSGNILESWLLVRTPSRILLSRIEKYFWDPWRVIIQIYSWKVYPPHSLLTNCATWNSVSNILHTCLRTIQTIISSFSHEGLMYYVGLISRIEKYFWDPWRVSIQIYSWKVYPPHSLLTNCATWNSVSNILHTCLRTIQTIISSFSHEGRMYYVGLISRIEKYIWDPWRVIIQIYSWKVYPPHSLLTNCATYDFISTSVEAL